MSRTMSLRTEHIDILVVDSRPEDYAQLAASPASRGMLFQFATSGADALKLWRTGSRSIWLINLRLSDGSGAELAAAIRARDPRSVVYVVGDRYDPAEEIEARICGAAMYVCKPAEMSWLALAASEHPRLAHCA